MKVVAYIFFFLAFSSFMMAILFKVMHWPGGSFMLVSSTPFIFLASLLVLIHLLISEGKKEKANEFSEKK